MKRLNVALVGLGLASQPHARSLVELSSRVRVCHAVSRSRQRGEAFAELYPFPVGTDIHAAITDPEVDLVILLTPPASHLELCELAFAHGKHVLVEKPLEVSLERAQLLVDGARQAGVKLGVVLQHRFRAGAQRLAQCLAGGELGSIQAATLALPWWRPQSYYDEPGRGSYARDGGGVLMTQAIHLLDLARAVLKPITVVSTQSTTTALHNMESEDHVTALLEVADKAPATLMASSAWYPGEAERLEILGTLGSAKLVGGDLDLHWLDGRHESVAESQGSGNGADPMAFSHLAHRCLIEDMLDAIGADRVPQVSGEDALATQYLIAQLVPHISDNQEIDKQGTGRKDPGK